MSEHSLVPKTCAVSVLCLLAAAILPAQTFTTLHSFTGGADGQFPVGTPVQATDGKLYGVTQIGGTGDLGTVFRITRGGALSTFGEFHTTAESVGDTINVYDTTNAISQPQLQHFTSAN